MKRFILFFLGVLMAQEISAQDIIVTRKSERIDAKIVKISETEVEYRKSNNPEGPIFVISCDKIASIVFANGDVQTFDQMTEKKVTPEKNINEVGKDNSVKSNFKFALFAGYSRPSLMSSSNGFSASVDFNGGYIGFGNMLKINDYLSFCPRYIFSVAIKEKMHMIDFMVPLLIKVGANINEAFGLYACAGPQMLLGLSAGEDYGKYPEGLNRFDIGITLGAGVCISDVCIDMTYAFGLLNRSNSSSSSGEAAPSVKSRCLALGVSIML